MRTSITAIVVALAVGLAFAGDADAKRKKRKRRKKAKPPAAEQSFEPEKAPPATETPPEPPAAPETPPPAPPPAAAEAAAPAAPTAAPAAEPAPASESTAPVTETAPAAASSVAVTEEITASEIGAVETAPKPDASEPASTEKPSPSFAVFAGVGGGFSQVVSRLGAGLRANIQGGAMLPFLGNRLQIYVGVGYAHAGRSASGDDARLEGGSYAFELVERELIVGGGLAARIWQPGTWFNIVLRAGADARMQKTDVDGDAGGADFGANQETATAVGAVFGAGAELMLGPGAVVGELGFSFADLSHTITGDASTGGIWIRAGYRLFF